MEDAQYLIITIKTMWGYTFYKGIKSQKGLYRFVNKTGDVPECESFQKYTRGDKTLIRNDGYIAEEEFDEDLFNGLPKTLKECL